MNRYLSLTLISMSLLGSIGCSQPKQPAVSSSQPASSSASTEKEDDNINLDDRGIDGMQSLATRMVFDASFGIPYSKEVPVDDDNTYCATTTSSIYKDDSAGETYRDAGSITYDYSISLDDDGDIVSATFGISNTSVNELTFSFAANLYFKVIAMMNYDTMDADILGDWVDESVSSIISTSGIYSIIMGDAEFTLCSIGEGKAGGSMWMDIAKADPS